MGDAREGELGIVGGILLDIGVGIGQTQTACGRHLAGSLAEMHLAPLAIAIGPLHLSRDGVDAGRNACTSCRTHKEDVAAVAVGHTMTEDTQRTHAQVDGIACLIHADAILYPSYDVGSLLACKSLAQHLPPGGEHLLAHTGRGYVRKPQRVGLHGEVEEVVIENFARYIAQILVAQCAQQLASVGFIGH